MGLVKTRFLCIDGDEILLDFMSIHFKKRDWPDGIDIFNASSFADAEILVKDGNFDLITTSLYLPIGDYRNPEVKYGGLNLLRNIRSGVYGKDKVDIPVIVLSGAAKLDDIMAKTTSPPENTWHMKKPYSIRELMKLLNTALDSRSS